MAIDIDDDIVQDFLVESREILEALSEQLVDLEQRPDDRELLNAVFRGFHTIKGGAGFLSLEPLVDVCHHTEDLFNLLRGGEKQVTAELMDTVLRALDVVTAMFGDLDAGRELAPAPADLLEHLETLNVPDSAAAAAVEPEAQAPAAVEPEAPTASAGAGEAQPEGDITDHEFEAILSSLDGQQPAASAPAPAAASDEITEEEFESLLDTLHGGGPPTGGDKPAPPPAEDKPAAKGSGDLITEDEFDALLDTLHGEGKGPGAQPAAKASTAKPAAPPPATEPAAAAKPPAAAKPSAAAKPAAAAKPSAESKPPADGAGKDAAARGDSSAKGETTVRVDTAKLDDIMNLVGELVLVRNRLSTLRSMMGEERMGQAVSDLEVVTADLQSAVMKTRMQPIKKVFGRFPRVVRDLARNLKKEVELELRGEDTDLDKNLVEALADPLVHLVRNSVDHGIEQPDEREQAGKPRLGKILLAAEQEGDHILLTIADDGKGMDAEFLRRKVIEKGLMDKESASRLDDHGCYNLIFMAGFSTKEAISDVSGRGVGMDVVKTRIAQLNGSVEIDSAMGRGTTMRIKVPLTLAILPTLMVKVQGRKFALPMSVVREIFELESARTNVVDSRLVVMVRNKAMPLFFLERWLARLADVVVKSKDEQDLGGERQVVTVVIGNQAVGFVVDEVLGLEEVVIKPLGAMLHGLPGLAGSTITGDGRIALIVDIPSLIKSFGSRM